MTDVKEYIEKGYIHSRVILEIMGKPEEHVKEAMNKYVDKIGKDNNIIIVKKFLSDSKKMENAELFSTFAELELLVKGFSALVDFCFSYMPASVEIYEPNKILVDANKMSNLFNDFQEKLHKTDFLAKTLSQQNQILMKNLNGMIKNALVILLKDQGLKLNEICKYTGLKEKDMLQYLDNLIKEKKIRKIGDKYFLEF